MTFEDDFRKEFPSYTKKIKCFCEVCTKHYMNVKDNCLDKQKVKDAIDKLSVYESSGYKKVYVQELLKELSGDEK